jgi:hemerythrin-like domain-containing protein
MTIAAFDTRHDHKGGSMTTNDTGRLSGDKVDFTLMYVAHRAFERDLQRLATAVEEGRTSDLAVRAGWDTFKNQLHIHHHAEDLSLWPALRHKTNRPDDVAVVDLMEAEHASIDPLLARVDASLGAEDETNLEPSIHTLTAALTAHVEHEENQALPLVATLLGPEGWAEFRSTVGKIQGLRGGAEFVPWMLDDTPAATRKQVLGLLPPPVRLLYRTTWRRSYARTGRWHAPRTSS